MKIRCRRNETATCCKKCRESGKKAAVTKLVAALRAQIIAERRNRFAEVVEGSGVLLLNVVGDLENAIKKSARQDVEEFIKMLRPDRGEHKDIEPSKP